MSAFGVGSAPFPQNSFGIKSSGAVNRSVPPSVCALDDNFWAGSGILAIKLKSAMQA